MWPSPAIREPLSTVPGTGGQQGQSEHGGLGPVGSWASGGRQWPVGELDHAAPAAAGVCHSGDRSVVSRWGWSGLVPVSAAEGPEMPSAAGSSHLRDPGWPWGKPVQGCGAGPCQKQCCSPACCGGTQGGPWAGLQAAGAPPVLAGAKELGSPVSSGPCPGRSPSLWVCSIRALRVMAPEATLVSIPTVRSRASPGYRPSRSFLLQRYPRAAGQAVRGVPAGAPGLLPLTAAASRVEGGPLPVRPRGSARGGGA